MSPGLSINYVTKEGDLGFITFVGKTHANFDIKLSKALQRMKMNSEIQIL